MSGEAGEPLVRLTWLDATQQIGSHRKRKEESANNSGPNGCYVASFADRVRQS